MTETLNIALLGAGQLGGSFVLALREQGVEMQVRAYDPVRQHAELLQQRGGVDVVCATPEEAVRGAAMVVLAAPLGCYRALADTLAPVLEAGCIVTDLGSVKGGMHALAALLPQAQIIPAHPIAGSERSGPEAARADLFQGKLCILTTDDTLDMAAFQVVEALWSRAGADVIAMPHQVHDQIYAHVSHLPHYIAFVAASYFHALGMQVAAGDGVLQQFLRISRSNPRMWTDVALANRESLLPVLATYIALLEHFATELRAGEPGAATGDKVALTKALLPRMLAASLISTVSLYEQQSGSNLRPFGAGGMRDIVAPAAYAPEEDTEAISHHAAVIATALEEIIPRFRALEALIGAEDAPGLYASICAMVEDAQALVSARN